MYAIQTVDRAYQVIDAENKTRFTGNLAECEAWLDREENQHASSCASVPATAASARSTLAFFQRWTPQIAKRVPNTE